MPALEKQLDLDKINNLCVILNQKAALVAMLRKGNGDVEELKTEINQYLDSLKKEVEPPFLLELFKKKVDRLQNVLRETFENLFVCSSEEINSAVGFVWESLKQFESLPASNSCFVSIFISASVLPLILDGALELKEQNEHFAKEALSNITFLSLLLKKLAIALKKNHVNDIDLEKIVGLASELSEIVDDYIIELDSLDENSVMLRKKAVVESCRVLIDLIPEESELMDLCVKKLSNLDLQ